MKVSSTETSNSTLAEQVDAAFDERLASRAQELAELMTNRKRLDVEREKLINAHFANVIDLETLKQHRDRIRIDLSDIDRRIADEHGNHEGPANTSAPRYGSWSTARRSTPRTDDQGKRLANQALTNGIEISEDEGATIRLAEPFAALPPTPTSADVRCSSVSEVVDVDGVQSHVLKRVERMEAWWKQARQGSDQSGDVGTSEVLEVVVAVRIEECSPQKRG